MKSKPVKKTAKTAPQDAPKKVFDVSRPGKTPVSPTSRPVIVGHKPQVKDPMMSDRDERPLMDSTKKVTVQPSAPAVSAPSADADTSSSAPASIPPTDADSGRLPSANPSLAQEGSRTVAGGTDGGAPGAPQPSGEHDGEASMSDRTRTPEPEATSAPEVPDAEKPAEPSAADSVATIATSSVVDGVPPPQEEAAEPAKPADPMAAGSKTSGLIFDELDGADTPDFTKPSQPTDTADSTVVGGTDGVPAQPDSNQDRSATQRRSLGGEERESEMTGDEPVVSGQAIVSHHKQSSGAGTVLLTLFILLLVAGIIFDILLDLGILNISNIPHTNFFPPN